jgi:hypothetical protein
MTGQGGHAKSPAGYFVAKNYGRSLWVSSSL